MSVDDDEKEKKKKTTLPVAPPSGGFQFNTAPKPKQFTPNGMHWRSVVFGILLARIGLATKNPVNLLWDPLQ